MVLAGLVAGHPGAGTAQDPGGAVAVEGRVVHSVTGRGVPFAIVSVEGLRLSTLTRRDGSFHLAVPPGPRRFEVRAIGFRMTRLAVDVVTRVEGLKVSLEPLPVELADIEVRARGENPAHRIIREAIARKNDLLARIHDYQYDAYVKFIIRDLNRDADSANAVALITETRTHAYWQQPDQYQETIVGRRQSSNLDAENNLVSVGQIVNFNQDRIDLEKYSVVSPTADDALDHYDYHIIDTLEVDGRRVFRLTIEPRSRAAPLFAGMIDIADSTFDVLDIDVGVNDAVRFDFFSNLRYRQRFAEVQPGAWMPDEIRFSGELHIGVPIPGFPEHMVFTHVASLQHFVFDQGNAPSTLGEYLIVVADSADEVDSTAWAAMRPAPLTSIERAAYHRIDSLEHRPASVGTVVLTGTVGALFLTGNRDFFRFNRASGLVLGLGASVRGLSPDWIFRARTGYAFGADRWQHRYGVSHRLSERQRLWVGATYRDEIVSRPSIISGGRNTSQLALLTGEDPLDYFREEGVSLSVGSRVTAFTRFQVAYNRFRHRSTPITDDNSLFDREPTVRPNRRVLDGRLRSLSATLTFDSRRRLKVKGRDYLLRELVTTQLTLGAEYADPDVLGGDMDFGRFYLRLHRRQRTLNIGLTSIDLALGTSTGTLPPQRYFTVDFGNRVFFEESGFNTLDRTNFSGDRAAMLLVVHDFDQQLFRRSHIPGIRDLPFTLSVHGGAFWTGFRRPTASSAGVLTAVGGYREVGFGIGNLTPMLAPLNFAVWFTWQLSDYPTRGFAFRVGIPAP